MQIVWGLSVCLILCLVVSQVGKTYSCLSIDNRAGCCMDEANISGSNNTLIIFRAVKMAPILLPQPQICINIVERRKPWLFPVSFLASQIGVKVVLGVNRTFRYI